MTRSLAFLAWLLPSLAGLLALALFALAGWNALSAGTLAPLLESAARNQPGWFCH